jgi:hypothetical protein
LSLVLIRLLSVRTDLVFCTHSTMHRARSTIRAAGRLRTLPLKSGRMMSVAATPEPTPSTQALLDLSAAYVLPVYARPDFVLSHGHGSYVYDTAGKRYLDFSAGIAVNALGHADAGVAQVRQVFWSKQSLIYFFQFFSYNVFYRQSRSRRESCFTRATSTTTSGRRDSRSCS